MLPHRSLGTSRGPSLLSVGIAALVLCGPFAASARDTETLLPAQAIAGSERGQRFLLAVPFYMKGAPHPEVEKGIATTEASRASSAALRSDRDACNAAFLDTLKILQQKVLDAGGDALVDVVSTTHGVTSESPVAFRCIAGAAVANVGLRGRIVRLAPE